MGICGRAPSGVHGQNPWWGVWRCSPSQKLMTLFYENMYAIWTGFNMNARLYESVQTEEKSVWRQKSGRAINNACPQPHYHN